MPLIIIVAHCSFVILGSPIVINFRFTMVSDRLIPSNHYYELAGNFFPQMVLLRNGLT